MAFQPLYYILYNIAILAAVISSSQSALNKKGRYVLLIGLDGLRYDIFDMVNMTNLQKLADSGVRAKSVRPANPPHSWPTQQTIITGLHPETHGIVSNEFWDPDLKKRFSYSSRPNFAINFWRTDGVEPIWLTNEKQGGISEVHSWAGLEAYDQPTYVGVRHFQGWNYFYSLKYRVDESIRYFKDNIGQIIHNLRSDTPPTFSALYWDHPDWCGHSFGPQSLEMKYTMRRTDAEAFGYLLEQFQRYNLTDKVNVIVTADHGMKRAIHIPEIGLNNYVDEFSYFLSETHTFAGLWPVKGKEDEIMRNLSKAEPLLKAYRKKDIPEHLHFGRNKRNAPIMVIPQDGYFVNYEDGSFSAPGTHIFPSDDIDMHSIFVATGPAFKESLVVDTFDSVDIYPLMTQILGIRPNGNNGSSDLTTQVLKEKFLHRLDHQVETVVAYIRPDIKSSSRSGIYGRVYMRSKRMIDGFWSTEIRLQLYGLKQDVRYKLAVFTYGHPHHLGCSNLGDVFKFFDIPQADNSLQTTVLGSKDGKLDIVFFQNDMNLHGPASIVGRMLSVKEISKNKVPLSCGSISPISPSLIEKAFSKSNAAEDEDPAAKS